MKKWKYLLIPITALLWHMCTYYGLYYIMIGGLFAFSVSWIFLIIVGLFLIGTAYQLLTVVIAISNVVILKFYNGNWFSCIIHSLAGISAIALLILITYANPPELVNGDEAVFFLTGMWRIAPFKTIIVFSAFLPYTITFIWASVVLPIMFKFFELD